jgi:hypothetical protein
MVLPWNIPTLAMKPWRLFRVLDRYTDEECEGLISQARGARLTGIVIAIILATILGVVGAVLLSVYLEHFFGRNSPWIADDLIQGRLVLCPIYAAFVSILITVAFAPYAIMVVSSITSKLRTVSCDCGYLMLGLSVAHGRVQCPECGVVHVLMDRGWEEKDIIAGASIRAELCYKHVDWRRRLSRLGFVLGIMGAWILIGTIGAFFAILVSVLSLQLLSLARR